MFEPYIPYKRKDCWSRSPNGESHTSSDRWTNRTRFYRVPSRIIGIPTVGGVVTCQPLRLDVNVKSVSRARVAVLVIQCTSLPCLIDTGEAIIRSFTCPPGVLLLHLLLRTPQICYCPYRQWEGKACVSLSFVTIKSGGHSTSIAHHTYIAQRGHGFR